MKIVDNVFALWAKTSQFDESWHPLLWHMMDSGHVAIVFWEKYLSESMKKEFQKTLELSSQETSNLLSFWCSLHDIGKAGPAFQRKSLRFIEPLKKLGLEFPREHSTLHGYHGLASTWILQKYFADHYSDTRFLIGLAMTIGGHHGQFPTNGDVIETTYRVDHLGNDAWQMSRINIINLLNEFFEVPIKFSTPKDRSSRNALFMQIAGLITMVDWIASNEEYFPYTTPNLAIQEYADISINRAKNALTQIGFDGWRASGEVRDFKQLFPEYTPNDLQQEFIKNTLGLQTPFLAILEAPTGSGKTESALLLADQSIQRDQSAGFYIAMPSQATSNQMFNRTVDFLGRRYSTETLNIHLVHGAALLNKEFEKLRFAGVAQDQEVKSGHLTSASWFLPRKKTLLAPFGIGTVDQTFQSVLRSKHFFLRMFGLSHKVIIFDEVHAYDVYMIEIFKRLLGWLRANHTSVIILSATLPETSRRELIEAYQGNPSAIAQIEFPRLTLVSPQGSIAYSLGKPPNRTISLNWLDDEELIPHCQKMLESGGNIAIICNRVLRVQQVYERLSQIFPEDEIIVFHSRFPYEWRAKIEQEVLEKYGKGSTNRPRRSIVIATQVIEQSLDLDFDAIISDLAPIDLLIQRAGRLHRHTHSATPPKRPERLSDPKFTIIKPKLEDTGMPDFGKDQYVYQKYILTRTYFAINEKTELVLPQETDLLINNVYSSAKMEFIPELLWDQLSIDFETLGRADSEAQQKAENMLIPECSRDLLGRVSSMFDDEHDPNSLSIVHTVTRDTLPSAQVVCLEQDLQGLFTLHGHQPIDLATNPDNQLIRFCLRSSISISNQALVRLLFASSIPDAWRKNPVMRTHYPLIFKEGICQMDEFQLVLDPKCGLIVTKSGS